jgi:hypothetical protein
MKVTTMVLAFLMISIAHADVSSGPKVGEIFKELKLFVASGLVENKEIDLFKDRGEKATVLLYLQAAKFDRPMYRLLKKLDEKASSDVPVVAIWLTEDQDKTKNFFERAKGSLQFANTSISLYPGEKTGPNGWGINLDAHLTMIVLQGTKVVDVAAFQSVNETDVKRISEGMDKLKK